MAAIVQYNKTEVVAFFQHHFPVYLSLDLKPFTRTMAHKCVYRHGYNLHHLSVCTLYGVSVLYASVL